MKPILIFNYGQETELPIEVIEDAPSRGPFDDYGKHLLKKYEIQVSLEDSIKYLETVGAWDQEELQDLEANKVRLLWISILDCKENKETFWYMGV